jgi:lipoate-protein ligase A
VSAGQDGGTERPEAAAVVAESEVWRLAEIAAPVEKIHDGDAALASAARRVAVVRHPTTAAVILGSTQPATGFDADRCAAAGYALARRRGGGGAVLVRPQGQVWIDLFLPRADRLFENDVLKSFRFVGEAWAAALRKIVGPEDDVVLAAPAPSGGDEWARVLCFAGVGAFEVLWRGRKVVGVSQRRDRSGAWFHTMAMFELGAAELADLLADPAKRRPAVVRLSEMATALPAAAAHDRMVAGVLAALPGALANGG